MKNTNYFTDKLNEALNNSMIKECYDNLNNAIDDFLNDEKTKLLYNDFKKMAKDGVDITDTLVGDLLNSNVVKEFKKKYKENNSFIGNTITTKTDKFAESSTKIANDIKNMLKDIVNNKVKETNYSNHTFVQYIQVNDTCNKIILSKHSSNYTISINETKYNITKEQYDDLYLILTTSDDEAAEYVMNSIYDVLNEPSLNNFCKKENTTQMATSCKCNTITSDTRFKPKFAIGDYVIVTKGTDKGYEGVIDNYTREHSCSGKRTLYYAVKNEATEKEKFFKACYLAKKCIPNDIKIEKLPSRKEINDLRHILNETSLLITQMSKILNNE